MPQSNPAKQDPATTDAFLRKVSSVAIKIAAESVTIPAGAAGAVVNFGLTTSPIANSLGNDLGSTSDNSLVLTSTTFTNLVNPPDLGDSGLANGDYYMDFLTGKARGRKADGLVTALATYNAFSLLTKSQSDLVGGGPNVVSETTLNVGNSPLVIDVAGSAVGQNGVNGYIANDSTTNTPANLTVALSHDGTNYDTAFTVAQGEVFSLFGRNVAKIKLTRVGTDCPFRLQAF